MGGPRRRHRRALTVMLTLLTASVVVAVWFDWYLGWFLSLACGVILAGLIDPSSKG